MNDMNDGPAWGLKLGECSTSWVNRAGCTISTNLTWFCMINRSRPFSITFIIFSYLFFQFSGGITGSIITATILRQDPSNISEDALSYCGVNDCPGLNITNPNEQKPDETVVSTHFIHCRVVLKLLVQTSWLIRPIYLSEIWLSWLIILSVPCNDVQPVTQSLLIS